MTYDAQFFADLFVEAAKRENARRSFKHGTSVGTGHIPFDTGATQNSIHVSRGSETSAVVSIGGKSAPYVVYLQFADNVGDTTVVNRHKNFVSKFARSEFVNELRRQFGDIKVE